MHSRVLDKDQTSEDVKPWALGFYPHQRFLGPKNDSEIAKSPNWKKPEESKENSV